VCALFYLFDIEGASRSREEQIFEKILQNGSGCRIHDLGFQDRMLEQLMQMDLGFWDLGRGEGKQQ
jgi:hypothetical protein